MIILINKHRYFHLLIFGLILLFSPLAHAQESTLQQGSATRVAAGDYLPVTIKLVNFGSDRRVDVQVTYKILNTEGNVISSERETVAVDTTASFVKQLLVPLGTPAGRYRAESDIQYPGQLSPAVSSFEFMIERTVLGIFMSDLIFFGGITLGIGVLSFIAGWFVIRARSKRGVLHDYGDKPRNERIYYEMISDIITQMRLRAGDRALDVALHMKGLVIDEETGRVLEITESPAKVAAGLVAGYEKVLGKQVSFSLRKNEKL